jgi:hypothetical protein
MGCGGTRAFAEAARFHFVRSARQNVLGTWTGLSAWLLAFSSFLGLAWGWRRPFVLAFWTVMVSLPFVFVFRAVTWWISLPAGALLGR